jgi:hypothetical protein
LVAGVDFERVFQSPELMSSLFAQADFADARLKAMGALKEMDHLWLSFVPPSDVVVLMTGKFEQGIGVVYRPTPLVPRSRTLRSVPCACDGRGGFSLIVFL